MFEKNLFNEEFFKFMRDITSSIQIINLTDENCSLGYYKDFEKIPEEERNTYKKIIDLL